MCVTYPEDELGISSVPAVADVVRKETPGKPVVFLWHQNADAVGALGLAHVLLPDNRQEERASRVHDSDVRQKPTSVVCLQRIDGAQEERVLRR